MTKTFFDKHIPMQIHTNGDASIDMMIKTVEKAGITAKDDRRTIIVHSQFQRPEHLPRYVELGLSPSYFTLHTFYWGDVHIKNIGQEAAFFISPMKAAKDAGIVMSNHTDFNVTPLNPFWVMWSAMARESRSGVIIGPDQRVDAYTALQALTTGPAWQVFEEDRKGRIKEGLLADFVILRNNPLKQEVSEIKDNEVLATIKEGNLIYKNNEVGSAPGAVSVDESASGKKVQIAAGGTLTVTLDANATTGFKWELKSIDDPSVLESQGGTYEAPKDTGMAGAGGQAIWTFKALEKGASSLSLEYSRPWEGGTKASKTFSLTVVVE